MIFQITLFNQNHRDVLFHARPRHGDLLMVRPRSVADSRQHVRDGVRHCHDILRDLPARLDESWHMPFARVISQAKPAHAKTPIKSPRPAAKRATVIFPHFEFIR
jgi:hypothetical protein